MHLISDISLIKLVSKNIGIYLDQTLAPYFILLSANHTAAKPTGNIRQGLQSIIL